MTVLQTSSASWLQYQEKSRREIKVKKVKEKKSSKKIKPELTDIKKCYMKINGYIPRQIYLTGNTYKCMAIRDRHVQTRIHFKTF